MTQALAVDLSYRLMRLSKVLREETAQFDKVKLELAEKYGKLNEETKQYLIEEGDPNKEKFLEEFEKLCETKISLGEFQKIKKQELGGIRITGLTLVNLEALLAAD